MLDEPALRTRTVSDIAGSGGYRLRKAVGVRIERGDAATTAFSSHATRWMRAAGCICETSTKTGDPLGATVAETSDEVGTPREVVP